MGKGSGHRQKEKQNTCPSKFLFGLKLGCTPRLTSSKVTCFQEKVKCSTYGRVPSEFSRATISFWTTWYFCYCFFQLTSLTTRHPWRRGDVQPLVANEYIYSLYIPEIQPSALSRSVYNAALVTWQIAPLKYFLTLPSHTDMSLLTPTHCIFCCSAHSWVIHSLGITAVVSIYSDIRGLCRAEGYKNKVLLTTSVTSRP